MKTVVFVDELLLVNFAAAAALLLGAGLLCGRSCAGVYALLRGQRGGCRKHPCPAGAAVVHPAGGTI